MKATGLDIQVHSVEDIISANTIGNVLHDVINEVLAFLCRE